MNTVRIPDGPVMQTLKRLSPDQVDAELEEVRRQKAELETYEALLQLVRSLASGGASNGDSVGKPTLRKAIRAVMLEDPMLGWRPAQMFKALDERGWAPGGKNARNQVQGRLGEMLAAGELHRDDGYYWLVDARERALSAGDDLRRAPS